MPRRVLETLCLAALAAGGAAADAQATVAQASSAHELQAAIQQGNRHVRVTEHLDLSALRVSTTFQDGYRISLFDVPSQLASLRAVSYTHLTLPTTPYV